MVDDDGRGQPTDGPKERTTADGRGRTKKSASFLSMPKSDGVADAAGRTDADGRSDATGPVNAEQRCGA